MKSSMKYTLLVLILFCATIQISNGQTQKIFNLNILNPGLGLELPISKKTLLN